MTDPLWPDVLGSLTAGRDLDEASARAAMRSIMSGEATAGQIGGFLLALRAKGETVEEITGLAGVMREFAVKVPYEGPTLDTCGTGGDRAGTINISTLAALAVAGAGVKVAKHGNRAASSRCGSADLLEGFGVVLDLSPEGVARCIEEAGIGFCFAPAFHPAMKHAGPVRWELGVPTVFNFLGPLTNPAGAKRQTIGVSDESMAPKLAEALLRLGTERAMVFRGNDGLDELSTTGSSRVWDVDGSVTESTFEPSSVGIALAAREDLAGGSVEDNVRIARVVLDGQQGPVTDAVALGAGAALVVAGEVSSIADGVERARESLASGAAARALDTLVELSKKLSG